MTGALRIAGPFVLAAGLLLETAPALSSPDAATAAVAAGLVSAFGFGAPFLRRRVRQRGLSGARSSARELAALREYVPGAVAEQIAQGKSPDCGEREVTVMFVDLHEYTAFAQDLAPQQVFAFLSRFTQAVSRAVCDEGGCVVEFNGDGMMAVFGAPGEKADKERAALRAARAALAAVSSLGPTPIQGQRGAPSVGIGLATGPAFVGSIRALDRSIWSAVGATTNLASRLQALSHQLDASIVVDAATREAAGFDPELVEVSQVRIRGLRAPVDLYVLSRTRSGLRLVKPIAIPAIAQCA